LKEKGYETGLIKEANKVYTKVPVFSFQKLKDVDTTLGPEMKSTGEVMGVDLTLEKSLYKGLVAAGFKIEEVGNVSFTVSDDSKEEALELAKRFSEIGYNLIATEGTAKFLVDNNLRVNKVGKISDAENTVLDAIYDGKINIIVNTTSKEKISTSDGFKIRRAASEQDIVCLTSLDTVDALLKVLESISFNIAEV
ncbi:carbamoyl-phosphate synthase large subunit, partial [Streptococcus danieliae]|nr:carbamoyl-phosphate synthase large subunit [Streptococcus danieliae]